MKVRVDLYCVGPGQAEKPHVHDAQDKVYYVLKGAGRFSLGGTEEALTERDALVAPPPKH